MVLSFVKSTYRRNRYEILRVPSVPQKWIIWGQICRYRILVVTGEETGGTTVGNWQLNNHGKDKSFKQMSWQPLRLQGLSRHPAASDQFSCCRNYLCSYGVKAAFHLPLDPLSMQQLMRSTNEHRMQPPHLMIGTI